MEFQIIIIKTWVPDTTQNYSHGRTFIRYVNLHGHLVFYLSTCKFEEPLKRLENRPNASTNTVPVNGSHLQGAFHLLPHQNSNSTAQRLGEAQCLGEAL